MKSRSSPLFAALFAVILGVIALVAWLTLRLEKRADTGSVASATASAPDTAPASPPATTTLTEAKPVQAEATSTRAAAPPALAKSDSGPTDAELADAWWVHGRVTFPEGTPIDERAFVVAQGKEFGKKKMHRVAVGPDGSFRVAFSKNTKKGALKLEARYVFLSENPSIKQADADKEVVLAGELGGALSGRVVPSAGAQPFVADLVGATVTATGWKRGVNSTRMVTTTVGEMLEFELGGLDPDVMWGVMCSPKGFAQTYVSQPSLTRGKTTPFDLKLERGGRVTGTVRDASGAPIEAAQLTTETRGDDGMGMPITATADKKGDFTLEGVRSGKVRIDARKSMYVPVRADELDVKDGETRTGVVVVLPRGNSVAGVVKWKDGKPAGGVRVEVKEPSRDDELHFYGLGDQTPGVKTGGDGTFTISGLHDGPFTVTARSAPKEVEAEEATATKDKKAPKVRFQAQADSVPSNANALVLVLDSGNVVRGRVLDDRGAAADAFTVKAEPASDAGDRWSARANTISRDFSDANGAFELFGLADGEWSVHVETKNGPKSEEVDVVLPRDEKMLDFVLARSAKLRGVVLDAGGAPIAGALVEADLKDEDRSWSMNAPEKAHLTRADGTFETDVRPGEIFVHASHAGWAGSERLPMTIAPAQAAGPVTLTLRKGALVTGEVHDKAGKLEAGRTVSIWNPDNRESSRATTDATGNFVLEHVAPGKATINLEPSKAEMEANRKADGSYSWSNGQSFNSQREIVLEEGGTLHVSLGGTSKEAVRVFGVVRASEPLADITVSFNRSDVQNRYGNQRQAVTDADGRYEMSIDAPGDYRVSFRTERGGNAWLTCTVPASPSFELDATLPVGSIAGRVLTDAGKPLGEIQVVVQLQDRRERKAGEIQGGSGYVQTAADGTFAVDMLPAGTYTITAEPQRWGEKSARAKSNGTARLEGVELAAGGKVSGLELRMPRAGSVRGIVLGPDGPVAGARVTPYENGKVSPAMTDETDASGRFQIDGLNPGKVVLVAATSDVTSHPSAPIEIRSDETAETELHVVPGGKVRINPVDAQGKLTHAPWTILDADGKPYHEMPLYWADGGSGWTVGPLPVGKYTVSVGEGENKVERVVEITAGTTQEVNVQFH